MVSPRMCEYDYHEFTHVRILWGVLITSEFLQLICQCQTPHSPGIYRFEAAQVLTWH